MHETAHIVIVDVDGDFRETLKDYLSDRGLKVTAMESAGAMRRLVANEEPVDLAILDIDLPHEDGLSLVRYLCDETQISVIIATASGGLADRIVGLEMGADDYLPKPVDLRELLARIKAVVRRRPTVAKAVPVRKMPACGGNVVAFGGCRLDLDSHKLFDEDGHEIPLKSMELDLLEAFASRPNQVLNRAQLLRLAHNKSWEPFDRSIDIRIARIRSKIEADPCCPEVIKTVRGVGYMFRTMPHDRDAGQSAAGAPRRRTADRRRSS